VNKEKKKGPWKKTCVEEIKAILGILVVKGICTLPTLEMYWSDKNSDFSPYIVCGVMPRNRFRELSQCLHVNAIEFSRVTFIPGYDRLYKVWKLLDLIQPKFEVAYTIHKELSVDEAMILFKGRLGLKQYMNSWEINFY